MMGGKGNSGGGIPFKVEGTTADPKIIPDIGGAAGSLVKGGVAGVGDAGKAPGAAVGAIGGLFGKKRNRSESSGWRSRLELELVAEKSRFLGQMRPSK